jgi:hypothetical protein
MKHADVVPLLPTKPMNRSLKLAWADVKSGNGNLSLIKQTKSQKRERVIMMIRIKVLRD